MIQSVQRAMEILSLFSHVRPCLGITEISQALKLPKGTVHGLTNTLVGGGYLKKDPDTRKYRLGLNILELGTIMIETLEINQKALQAVRQLSKKTEFLVRLAVWDGFSVVITMTTNSLSSELEGLAHHLGPRIPAYCSALGKAILAYLDSDDLVNYLAKTELIAYTPDTINSKENLLIEIEKIRQQGYAVSRRELLLDTACLAAPIFDHQGRVMAATSLTTTPNRLLEKKESHYASLVIETAWIISREMGYFPEKMAFSVR